MIERVKKEKSRAQNGQALNPKQRSLQFEDASSIVDLGLKHCVVLLNAEDGTVEGGRRLRRMSTGGEDIKPEDPRASQSIKA